MNVPNLLTILRLLLIPVFGVCYFLVSDEYFYLPAAILLLSGLTDMLDGAIARKYHLITQLGQFLDPLADKLTMATVVVCLALTHASLRLLLLVLFVKELLLAFIGLFRLKSWRNSPPAKWYGKVTTMLLYALFLLAILFRDFPEPLLFLLSLLPMFFMILSFIFYLKEINEIKKEL